MIKCDNDRYVIGDHTNSANPLGIAQYLNCAMRSSGSKNNCKLIRVTMNKEEMFVAKITVPVVNVGQQLFTPYGRSLIIPKHAFRQAYPPSLLHTIAPNAGEPAIQSISIPTMPDTTEVEGLPHTAAIVPKHYGYSTDRLWEITMCIEGAMEI